MYQVKFDIEGETKYGIVSKYAEKAKVLPEDKVMIEDSITPAVYVLDVTEIEEVDLEVYPSEYTSFVETQKREAISKSTGISQLGPGKIISVPCQHKTSYYVVTDTNEDQVHIEWRGYSDDRCVPPAFTYGGWFERELIERLLKSDQRIAAYERQNVLKN